ncbi:MAG: hypothetical protein ACLFQ6_04110 [Candidatus Sumerlaeia bacterium]
MKVGKLILCVTILMAMFTGLAAAQAPGMGQPQVPMPKSLDEALASIYVGDVSGLIENAGNLAGKFKPGMSGPGLKAMAGMMVQDAGLQGFSEPGSGLMVYAFNGPVFIAYAEVGAGQIQNYKMALEQQGMGAQVAGDMLAVAMPPNAISTAATLAPTARAALADPRGAKSTLKIMGYPNKAIAAFGPQLQGMLQMMAQPGDELNPIMQMTLLKALADSSETSLELDLDPANMNIQTICKAMPNTPLATYVDSPVSTNPELMSMLPTDGAIRSVFSMNSEAYVRAAKAYAQKAFEELDTPADLQKDFMELYVEPSEMYEGEMNTAINMFVPGKGMLSGASITSIKDAEKGITIMEKTVENLKNNQAIKSMEAQGLKMDVEFHKNIRSHKGTQIHQWKMKMESTQNPQQMDQLQEMLGSMEYEMSIVGDMMVVAMGDVAIEPLIDAAKTKSHPGAKALSSIDAFGKGQDAYADIDMGAFMKVVANSVGSMMGPGGNNPINVFAESLQGSAPMVMTASARESSLMAVVNVPPALIDAMGKAVQKMQQQGGEM